MVDECEVEGLVRSNDSFMTGAKLRNGAVKMSSISDASEQDRYALSVDTSQVTWLQNRLRLIVTNDEEFLDSSPVDMLEHIFIRRDQDVQCLLETRNLGDEFSMSIFRISYLVRVLFILANAAFQVLPLTISLKLLETCFELPKIGGYGRKISLFVTRAFASVSCALHSRSTTVEQYRMPLQLQHSLQARSMQMPDWTWVQRWPDLALQPR